MKSVFYFLSILLIGAGGFFAYQNKINLIDKEDQTVATIEIKEQLKSNIRDEEAARDGLYAEIKATKESIAETEASIESFIGKEARSKKQLVALESEVQEVETELAKFEELLLRIEDALRGQNINSIQEVPDKIAELRTESEEKTDALKSIEIINENLTAKVNNETGERNTARDRLATIKGRVYDNAMNATITSINPEWGFVIVNAGSDNSNIVSNAELVVRRGGRYLGKLKAAAVSPTQTICDIEGDGVSATFRAGDEVILKEAVVK